MTNTELIRDYLSAATPGRLDVDRVATFLHPDVVVDDPLMAAEGADVFLAALRQAATASEGMPMSSTVQDVIGEDGVVAARILFEAGGMSVQFCQWFWLTERKIARIQVVYDPRPFLEMGS